MRYIIQFCIPTYSSGPRPFIITAIDCISNYSATVGKIHLSAHMRKGSKGENEWRLGSDSRRARILCKDIMEAVKAGITNALKLLQQD